MPRPAGERRAPDRNRATAFTPAQQGVLLEALRVHPTVLQQPNARVAAALVSAGVMRQASTDVESAFALTPEGLDVAARLSAQRVIDAVNTRRAGGAREAGRQGAPPPNANSPSGKPADWPFPHSGHAW